MISGHACQPSLGWTSLLPHIVLDQLMDGPIPATPIAHFAGMNTIGGVFVMRMDILNKKTR
jgi:NADH:ubiquinone oxidoreductase subunit 5 (subunit L)/multisubunit Na+/H+ antiporter MnhA subunit